MKTVRKIQIAGCFKDSDFIKPKLFLNRYTFSFSIKSLFGILFPGFVFGVKEIIL